MTYRINVLVDWGKAFVDENGSFYCGTTDEHKHKAAAILDTKPDLVLEYSDLHALNTPEFNTNGGLYPVHNLIRRHWELAKTIPGYDQKNTSPELTDIIAEKLKDRTAGIIAPRHTFFQNYNGEKVEDIKPIYVLDDVVDTFRKPLLNPTEFLNGNVNHVIQTKYHKSGTIERATEWMGSYEGVPTQQLTITSLLRQKYGLGEELEFVFSGVVTGICLGQTAEGMKDEFPRAKVTIISDACKHLVGKQFGLRDDAHGDEASLARFAQMGIEYITVDKYLEKMDAKK
jgi:nicotinamidase-related amidase